MNDRALLALMRTIAARDAAGVRKLLTAAPTLARAALKSREPFLDDIRRQLYVGDTALHVAAAAFETAPLEQLLALGADVRARNRRGAEPLHSAAVAAPGTTSWAPAAQARTIAALVAAGADVNAAEPGSGVTPLHRAVRTRGAEAVRALLALGADPRRTNKAGSTALTLARLTTGRSGAGSDAAKAEQKKIIQLLAG